MLNLKQKFSSKLKFTSGQNKNASGYFPLFPETNPSQTSLQPKQHGTRSALEAAAPKTLITQ